MITQPKFNTLNADAFFGFYADLVQSIQRYGTEALAPYAAPIETMYLQLKEGYKLGRMNKITTELKVLDEQRDRALRGLKKILKGYELSNDAAETEAATRLLYSLNKYGNITRLIYSEQSGALTRLLNEWKTNPLKDNLELLHLSSWIENLRSVQERFSVRYLDRAEEEATRTAIPISKLRPEATKLYQDFVLMLTAFARTNPNEHDPLVRLLDELGKKYNEASRNRSGKSSKKEVAAQGDA